MTGFASKRAMAYSKDNVEQFQRKYDARVEPSREYNWREYQPIHNHYEYNNTYIDPTTHRVEPMTAIHMPPKHFEHLLAQEQIIEHMKSDAEYGKKILTQLRADERVRDDNPAVAKAYRNYLMLLELARK